MREITGPTPTSFAGDDDILTTTTKETRQTSLPGRQTLPIDFSIAGMADPHSCRDRVTGPGKSEQTTHC
jgi:hypothetical protein